MRIRAATLVPDTATACGVGTRGAHTALVRVDGTLTRAFIKPLTKPQIAGECFAALLLRAWSLNVPEPLIVAHQDTTEWFGSVDVGYPDLRKRFTIDATRLNEPEMQRRATAAAQLICSFASTPLALVCDEAIGNGDRNFENVLWDGGLPAWIDHERSLGLPDSSDANLLAGMAVAVGSSDVVQRGAVAHALTLAHDALDAVAAAMPTEAAYVQFVRGRLPELASRILSRFPAPENDLFRQPG